MINDQLNITLNSLLHTENDRIRSFLFLAANSFYDDTLDDSYVWPSHSIKLEFEEWHEYFTKDRPSLINLMIEEELLLENSDNKDTSNLEDIVSKIKSYDHANLMMLIKNRDIINTYV